MGYVEDLQEAMVRLDMVLTEHTREECQHTSRVFDYHNIEDFIMGDLYSLSDCGYSRIHILIDDKHVASLFLCIGAEPKVIYNWDSLLAKECRKEVEEIINEYIQKCMTD